MPSTRGEQFVTKKRYSGVSRSVVWECKKKERNKRNKSKYKLLKQANAYLHTRCSGSPLRKS